MDKTVRDFYRTFDFAKVVTDAPQPIQGFLDKEIEFISAHIRQGASVLEIGCGYGRLLSVLAEKAGRVVGIDFSESLLDRARHSLSAKPNIELRLADAQNIDIPGNSFDYVLCLDASFGNMPGIEEKVITEMTRLAKSGGEVILSIFSEIAVHAQLENYRRIGLTGLIDDGMAIRSDEGFYSRRFTKEQLRSLYAGAGMNCEINSLCPINYVAIGKKP